MVRIVVLVTVLVYINADEYSLQTMKIKVNEHSIGDFACQPFNNNLTEGESAFIDFYYTGPDVECIVNNRKLQLSPTAEVSSCRKYKLGKVEAWMHGTWKCSILPNKATCDVPVTVHSKHLAPKTVYTAGSWIVKVNDVVLGTDQAYQQLYDSFTLYEFCENELVRVDCGKAKSAIITVTVKDEPMVRCVHHNSLQSTILIRLKAEYDGKYIQCQYNEEDVYSVVRINLKLKQMQDVTAGGISTGSELTCRTTFTPETDIKDLHVCNSPDCPTDSPFSSELKGLQQRNLIFFCKNSTNDKQIDNDGTQIHYEYTDNQTINLTWTVALVPNMWNEYAVYWNDTLVSTVPVATAEASCVLTQEYPTITPSSGDDGTVIRLVKKVGEKAFDKYRIMLQRSPRDTAKKNDAVDTSSEKIDPTMLKFYIITGVLGFIIVILIIGIIWILRYIRVKAPEPILRSNHAECHPGNVYEEIPPFPPQWDKFSYRESTNTAYEGGEGLYSEIRVAEEQTLGKQLR